jgi:heat shock protein HtpX
MATRRPMFFSSYARTAVLMAALFALLAAGGRAVAGTDGLLLFGGLGLAVNAVMYWFSDKLALLAHRAQEVSAAEAPTLHAAVSRLARGAGLPTPRLYLIPSEAPNAFATGRGPRHAAIAVTEGLLHELSERELEAVLAHELAHIKNRDVLVATIAAAVAGLISTAGYVMQWGLMLGGRNDGDERSGGLAALAWIIVAPLIAVFIQLAISRSREYGADAAAARLTGDPNALADALTTLEHSRTRQRYEFGGPATAHLFIVSPVRGSAAALVNMFSTHPPIEERVRRLRRMA